MRRILLAIGVLAVALTVGCSRQAPPHVGEWETEIFAGPRSVIWGGNYVFLENGSIQFVRINIDKPKSVVTGKYKVDYSKDPIQIDIEWEDGTLKHGIIRFIGETKGFMEMELTTPENNGRPDHFGGAAMLLTKKVKK